MAELNLKISQLPEKMTLENEDLIPIVNQSVDPSMTSKVRLASVRASLTGPQGETGDSYLWRGLWLTATIYAINDCISFNGSGYVCRVAHTSGSFATDLGTLYWSMFVQKGETGETGATGVQGATGTNVNLLYGTSDTPPGGVTPDGTLYVTYIG